MGIGVLDTATMEDHGEATVITVTAIPTGVTAITTVGMTPIIMGDMVATVVIAAIATTTTVLPGTGDSNPFLRNRLAAPRGQP